MNRFLVLTLGIALSNCAAAWEAIAYSAGPLAAGQDPRSEVESILSSKPGCISRVFWAEQTMRVEARCAETTLQYVAHFDRVQRIELKQHNKDASWYLVALSHTDGSAEFYWQPRNLDEAKHLADALNALKTR